VVEAIHGARERPFPVIHNLTESTRAWLLDYLVDVVIDQSAQLVGSSR
jgi:hypothetical protein